MTTLETYKSFYKKYLDQCYFNGDIWAEYYEPFTFQEWMISGMPDGPGKTDKYCKKRIKE